MKSQTKFTKAIKDSISVKERLLLHEKKISQIIKIIYNSLRLGGKVMLCGNGGSAADAQHLAAEFTVRLKPTINRKPIPAISLSSDISTITACANDYGYENIFVRNLEALYKENDILIAISTSGNSKNIIKVLKYCKKNKIPSIGFLGSNGGNAKKYCKYSIVVPSKITARIQETHIFLGHFIFESVERMIINK